MKTSGSPNGFDSTTLLLLLWKWRWRILIVLIATVIGASAVSLLIREKYKSTAIIFPAKSNTVVLGKKFNVSQDINQFGEEEEAEQALQILNSAQVRDRIIARYDLMRHYGIDTTSKFKNTALVKEYHANVKCSRTRFGSITIEVLDYSPDTAALIANDIARLLDSAKNKMLHERAMEAFLIIEKEYLELQDEIKQLTDTMTRLSELGVVGSSQEQASLIESYGHRLNDRNPDKIKELEEQININRKYRVAYSSFAEQAELKNKRQDEMEATYMQAKVDATKPISHKFEVEPATKAEKKAYPIRWLIVFISTVSALFFMIFLIIVIEKIKELKQQSQS